MANLSAMSLPVDRITISGTRSSGAERFQHLIPVFDPKGMGSDFTAIASGQALSLSSGDWVFRAFSPCQEDVVPTVVTAAASFQLAAARCVASIFCMRKQEPLSA